MTNDELCLAIDAAHTNMRKWGTSDAAYRTWEKHLTGLMDIQLKRAYAGEGGPVPLSEWQELNDRVDILEDLLQRARWKIDSACDTNLCREIDMALGNEPTVNVVSFCLGCGNSVEGCVCGSRPSPSHAAINLHMKCWRCGRPLPECSCEVPAASA